VSLDELFVGGSRYVAPVRRNDRRVCRSRDRPLPKQSQGGTSRLVAIGGQLMAVYSPVSVIADLRARPVVLLPS
jgi:hypothetical protein